MSFSISQPLSVRIVITINDFYVDVKVVARKGQTTYNGLFDCATKIYKEEGARAFWKGAGGKLRVIIFCNFAANIIYSFVIGYSSSISIFSSIWCYSIIVRIIATIILHRFRRIVSILFSYSIRIDLRANL